MKNNSNYLKGRKEDLVTPSSGKAVDVQSPPLLFQRSPNPLLSQSKTQKPFSVRDDHTITPANVSKYQSDEFSSNYCYHTPENGFSFVKDNRKHYNEQRSQDPYVPYIPILDLQHYPSFNQRNELYRLKPKKVINYLIVQFEFSVVL